MWLPEEEDAMLGDVVASIIASLYTFRYTPPAKWLLLWTMEYMHTFYSYVETYVHICDTCAYMQACLGAYSIYAGIYAYM